MADKRGKGGSSENLLFLGSKITADSDCSHEIRRWLPLGRKVMTNLDSVLKSWGINLPTMVWIVKAIVFPVVMYGSESWTVEKAECQRIWCLWTVVLEKTRESPLASKIKSVNIKGNQLWMFTGGIDAEAEAPYFGHLMWTTESLEKSLIMGKLRAEKEEGVRGWDGWFTSLMQWTWTWANSGRW